MRREFGGRSSGDSKSTSKRSHESTVDSSLSPYHSHEDLTSLATGGDDNETITQYNLWIDNLTSGTAQSRGRAMQMIREEFVRLNASFIVFAADHLITIFDQSFKLFSDVKVEKKLRKEALKCVVQMALVCGDDFPELYDRAARSLVMEFLFHPLNQPSKMKRGAAASQEELMAEAWAAVSVLFAANDRLTIEDRSLGDILMTHDQSPLLPSNSGSGSSRKAVSKHPAAAALAAAASVDISRRRALRDYLLAALQIVDSTTTSPVVDNEEVEGGLSSPTTAEAALNSNSEGSSIPNVSPLCYLWNAVGVLEDRFRGTFTEDDVRDVLKPLAEHPTPDKPLVQMQRTVLAQLDSTDGSTAVATRAAAVPVTKIQFRERHVDVIGFARIYTYDVTRYFLLSMLLVHAAKNATVRRVLHVQGDVVAKHTQEEIALNKQALQDRLVEKEENLKERAKQRKQKTQRGGGAVDDDE